MKRLLTTALLILLSAIGVRADYDPLLVAKAQPEQKDLTIKDEKRSREIPVRIYLPADKAASPVVLFSHGLGGNREGSAFLGKHWALRGYAAVFLQHPGSDDSVWKNKPVAERMAALKGERQEKTYQRVGWTPRPSGNVRTDEASILRGRFHLPLAKQAAGLKDFLLRVQDVPVVLDQLEVWNKDAAHLFAGRLDLKHIGMSGHSFGAVTTQATSGQSYAVGKGFTDSRIKAAVVMSPGGPANSDTKSAFGDVKIPWMLLTGTKDSSPINGADAKSRLVVFPALPPGGKYELILNKAEHSVFTERALPGETEQRNPNHHRAILAVTTAFWDATLRNDAEARKWLDGEAVRSVLEKDDQWQTK